MLGVVVVVWCWYCENPSSRLKRSGWRYSPSLLFTPSLPPNRLRPTQQSGKSGKENFNNALIFNAFHSPQYDNVFHHLMADICGSFHFAYFRFLFIWLLC